MGNGISQREAKGEDLTFCKYPKPSLERHELTILDLDDVVPDTKA